MTASITLTTVVENTSTREGLEAEHGLAVFVETGAGKALFDTGAGRALAANAAALGVDLAAIDALVLSHGHYDHTGAVDYVLDKAPKAGVFLHPQAISAKYSRKPGSEARYIGMPEAGAKSIAAKDAAGRVVWTDLPTEVLGDMYVTGDIPRVTDFEGGSAGAGFFSDAGATRPDRLTDDQALFFDTAEGPVVVLGCAHAGVGNTLKYISWLTGRRRIHAVIGGMHLGGASPERMQGTIAALPKFGVGLIAPAHCTGAEAVAELRKVFSQQVTECTAGSTFTFESAGVHVS